MIDTLRKDFSGAALWQGILVALVGYASSVALVIQGLAAMGASVGQITSGLIALGLGKGIVAIALSYRMRMPISIAWTTPGMALLATMAAVEGGFPAAIGAFMLVGGMIMLAGFWSPLGRLVAAIPKPIANAMLAGILFKLCLAPFLAIPQAPVIASAVLLVWLIVGRFARLYAVPAAVVTATMASQNIPGLAVLAAFDYRPRVPPILYATGAAAILSAPFGAPTINLAAITAALCAGPDAHVDPKRRYIAALAAGVGYMALIALAGIAATLVLRSPPILIEAVAGLALIGAFGGAILNAVQDETDRLPALTTFFVTASGIALFGIGAAFWGLITGLLVHVLYAAKIPEQQRADG